VKFIKILKVPLFVSILFVFFMLIIQNLITGVPKALVNYINVIEKSDETFAIETRKRILSVENSDLSTISEELQFFNDDEVALVLIHPDVEDSNFDSHSVRKRNNIEGPLKQLVELAREKNIRTYFTPAATSKGFHSSLSLDNNSRVPDFLPNQMKQFFFHNFLAFTGINTILIAGYDLNSCLYENPIGLRNLSLAGFNVILVRDATVAIEYFAGTDSYDNFISFIERDRASTTNLNALKNTLNSK
jgi:nicotinamidase-related amidase